MKTFWCVKDSKGIVALVFTEEKAIAFQQSDNVTDATIEELPFEVFEEFQHQALEESGRNE